MPDVMALAFDPERSPRKKRVCGECGKTQWGDLTWVCSTHPRATYTEPDKLYFGRRIQLADPPESGFSVYVWAMIDKARRLGETINRERQPKKKGRGK